MQTRMGMSDMLGSGESKFMQWLQGQQHKGLDFMGGVAGMQQGLNENQANAYVQSLNAQNAARSSRMNILTGLVGATLGGGYGQKRDQ